jgi:hypothetical protein
MTRRRFIALPAGAAAAWSLAARAQQGERMRRIGVLLPAAPDDAEVQSGVGAFLQGLAQLGWSPRRRGDRVRRTRDGGSHETSAPPISASSSERLARGQPPRSQK